jgi:hypothetical protein
MKQIKFKKKLRFHKETIADLNSHQLRAAHGGQDTPPDPDIRPKPISTLGILCPLSQTGCLTQCPSNDSIADICCAYC